MNSHQGYYDLTLEFFSKDPALAQFSSQLEGYSPISSQLEFTNFCEQACSLWRTEVSKEGMGEPIIYHERYKNLILNSNRNVDTDLSFPTPWGGVVVTRFIHPFVEKYLVVEPGRFLALEKHSEKVECLSVNEGRGILLRGQKESNVLEVTELTPGSNCYFIPGEVHCIIGTEGLVIFERSIDPKGLDQDLIFIYS